MSDELHTQIIRELQAEVERLTRGLEFAMTALKSTADVGGSYGHLIALRAYEQLCEFNEGKREEFGDE